jgi:hypothetical protein
MPSEVWYNGTGQKNELRSYKKIAIKMTYKGHCGKRLGNEGCKTQ